MRAVWFFIAGFFLYFGYRFFVNLKAVRKQEKLARQLSVDAKIATANANCVHDYALKGLPNMDIGEPDHWRCVRCGDEVKY